MVKISVTKDKKRIERYRSSVRDYISKFRLGKRILLKDGTSGYFVELLGNQFEGEEMVVKIEGKNRTVDIQEFKATLSEKENVKCPLCGCPHLTGGFLKGYSDSSLNFTADVSEDVYVAPSFEDQRVRVNKCVNCDYILLFAEGNQDVTRGVAW